MADDQKPVRYKALVGLDYGTSRVEVDEVVDNIPPESVSWLLRDKLIETVEE